MLRRPDTGDDSGSGFDVLELHEPVGKCVGLVEGVHDEIVSTWIQKSIGESLFHVDGKDGHNFNEISLQYLNIIKDRQSARDSPFYLAEHYVTLTARLALTHYNLSRYSEVPR